MSTPWARPVLALVTDASLGGERLPERVEAAVRGGVDWVQVRDRSLAAASLLSLCETLRARARRADPAVRILVNRRVDVAWAGQLDGVHLGFDAAPVADARGQLGADAIIGVATHAADEVAALESACDYAHLAPIFTPLSKPASRPALGLGAIEAAAGHRCPVLAQGGIAPENAGACITAGAAGVAVTGGILGAADPMAAAAALRAALDHARSGLANDR